MSLEKLKTMSYEQALSINNLIHSIITIHQCEL